MKKAKRMARFGPRKKFEETEHPRRGGKFVEKPGGGEELEYKPVAKRAHAQVKGIAESSTAMEGRAYQGQQIETTTKLSKQEAGNIGEKLAIAHLRETLAPDFGHLNTDIPNYPIDVIGDHSVVEVKTGLVSNSKEAQQWRATIGQPSKTETAWLKTASPEAKRAYNDKKRQAILDRKKSALAEQSAKYGQQLKPKTVTVILNPDTKTADIYEFDDFHLRIGWNSPEAKKAYVRTVRYE